MLLKTVFRYPGGKTKIAKNIVGQIRKIMGNDCFAPRDFKFVDVFMGGGSVTLAVMNEFPATKIVVNDLDEYIYSFWNVLAKGKSDKLLEYIKTYNPPTVEMFNELRKEIEDGVKADESRKGFYALFFNRTAFSGIFRSGPIGKYDQTGKYKIDCRYNGIKMGEMIKRTSEVFSRRKVQCYNKDFVDIIKEYGGDKNVFLYLDPPYWKQGEQLYNHSMEPNQYKEMADLLKHCKANWLVSHDDHPEFVELFKWATIRTIENVPYTINAIKDKRKSELLIHR